MLVLLDKLSTSRELLRVRGEVEYEVLPLADQDPVSLFCLRAQLQATAAIDELSRRLDNMPPSARAGRISGEESSRRSRFSSGSSQRLDLLKGGRDADPRQLTLRATIEWSHDLLYDVRSSSCSHPLAVFAGRRRALEAAEAVCDADLDTLQSLVDKSLPAGGPPAPLLDARNEQGECARGGWRRRLGGVMSSSGIATLSLARAAEIGEQGAPSGAMVEPVGRGAGQHPRGDREGRRTRKPRRTARSAALLKNFWHVRGHLPERKRHIERALHLAHDVDHAIRTPALAALAYCMFYLGDDPAAASALTRRRSRSTRRPATSPAPDEWSFFSESKPR